MRTFLGFLGIAFFVLALSDRARARDEDELAGPPAVVGLTEAQDALARLALDERMFVAPYVKHGMHGGKPVEANIAFLREAAPWFHYGMDLVELTSLSKQAIAIIDGGERDPWVLRVAGCVLSEAGGNDFRAGLALQKAVEAVEASGYPAREKALVLLSQARVLFNSKQGFGVWSRPYDRYAELLMEHLRTWRGERAEAKYLLRIISMSDIGWRDIPRDATLNFAKTLESTSFDNAEAECIRLTMLLDYHLDRGWEIRGRGYAHTVREEDWEPFYTSLQEAERFGAQGFALCPDWEEAPAAMIMVAVGLGERAKDSPTKWFERATAAKYDHRPAYSAYAEHLHPKWSGEGPERLIEFGRRCLRTGRFDTRVPTAMTDVPRLLSTKDDRNPFVGAFDDKAVYDDAMSAVMGFLRHDSAAQHDMSLPAPERIVAAWRVRLNVTRALIYTSAMAEFDRGYAVIEQYGPARYEPELNRYPFVRWNPLVRTLINAGPGKEIAEKASLAFRSKDFDGAIGFYDQWLKVQVPEGPHAAAIREERKVAHMVLVSGTRSASRENKEQQAEPGKRDEK